jgi:hypothetical protein
MIHNCPMARTKLIPDADILYTVRHRMIEGGTRAASFSTIAAATGLSAPALVLRFGSQAQMCQAALIAGWAELTLRAKVDLPPSKNIQSYLKHQADYIDIPALLTLSQGDEATRTAASTWRAAVETTLARHFGDGLQGRNAAGLVFAAWQGRLAWTAAGGKSFRFGALIRNLP